MALPSSEDIYNKLKGTVLYESTEFATTGTLSDSITNYERIKVHATSSDGHNVVQELLTSQITENGYLRTSLWSGSIASEADSTYYAKTARFTLNDNTFTLDRYYAMNIKTTPKVTITSNNSFTILKIVGYKY